MSTHTVPVDPANAEQSTAWNGGEGAYWAEHANQLDRIIAGHDRPFQAAATIQPTDRVLDVGCGTGQNTRDAARAAPAGSGLGVDLPAPILDSARRVAEPDRLTNCTFLQADRHIHPFATASSEAASC